MSIYEKPGGPRRRVVVTGISCISAVGNDADTTWNALLNQKSGIGLITQFDPSQHDAKIAGEVKNFDPDQFIQKKEQKKMDRFIHFSVACTQMALKDSGLGPTFSGDAIQQRVGVFVGVGIGGLSMIERQHQILMERGPSRITPFFIPSVISNLASGQISIMTGAKGPNYSITSACASGAHSIGEAARYIQEGRCDVMIAGGSEATVTPIAIAGFASMKALSTRNHQPEAASRPWDKDRDGFVLAEGCGILILEDFEHAAKRGARIYGEVTGYGVSSDAYHMTGPAAGGEGAALAMSWALKDANLTPDKIDYINAHGTSTPMGDEIETKAIHKVFKDHAAKVWVSSTKSMTGHTLGAAGAIESVFAIKTLHHGIAPGTLNLDNPSDDCDLDYLPGAAREKKMTHVMNNSFGFGGTNATLIFSKI
jgi:3-oxoacyl-[acyl-carrier-protein] synthase II